MISYRLLIGIPIAALVCVFLLVRSMHQLSLRMQFMVLLGLGVSIGFIFLVMVQMPQFPQSFGVSLIVVVFIASLFGTRIFLRSMAHPPAFFVRSFSMMVKADSSKLSYSCTRAS